VYLEPLLRWLRAGRKGYMIGALASEGESHQEEYQISDITYADDVNILTGGKDGLEEMKHQANKLGHYTDWGHLIVNNTKTTITGALHHSLPSTPYHEETLSMSLRAIQIHGKAIAYQSPKTPFRHLGVYLTMDLNHTHQFKMTMEKIRKQVQSLRWSYASSSQRRRIIETCTRPAITYAYCAAPYTLAQLKELDSLLTKAIKQTYRLSTSMSTAAAHQDISAGGLGCHLLEVEYNLICHQNVVRALNDEGPRGVFTRAMFKLQKIGVDALSAAHLPHTILFSLRQRRLMSLKRCSTRLYCKGIAHDKLTEMNALATTLDAIMPGRTKWDARLVQDLHMLGSTGVAAVEDMLIPTRTHVAPVSSCFK
jgi:hypothetical protein